MIKVGEHITLDIIGTDKEYDPSVYERVIKEIAKEAKVTILNISKYNLNLKVLPFLLYWLKATLVFILFQKKELLVLISLLVEK